MNRRAQDRERAAAEAAAKAQRAEAEREASADAQAGGRDLERASWWARAEVLRSPLDQK